MIRPAIILIFLVCFLPIHCQDGFLTKKEKKEASRFFPGDLQVEQADLEGQTLALDSLLMEGDAVFQFKLDGELTGYMLRTRAMGRYDHFDYVVFYSPELTVKGVKVTVYRSTHGAAICQKKWLSQFEGYQGGQLVLGKDIDAISGASISAQALVGDMQRCLMLMTGLKNTGAIG